MQYIYVVSIDIAYEGSELMGVFSDYVKAREFMLTKSQGSWQSGEDYVIRKVELDRIDYRCGDVGEEV